MSLNEYEVTARQDPRGAGACATLCCASASCARVYGDACGSRVGIFRNLHRWLDDNMARFDFFRRYNYFLGGMFPEPWHLRYAPAALQAMGSVNVELLARVTSQADMLGKELALERMAEIYSQHILNIVGPDQQTPIVRDE